MKRFAYFVNLLFLPASLCDTLFCVHRFARRRTIAKGRPSLQGFFPTAAGMAAAFLILSF